MFLAKHRVETISFFLLAFAIGIFIAIGVSRNSTQFNSGADTMPVRVVNPLSTSLPTEDIAPQKTIISQISSDASKKVVLETTQNNDGSQTFVLFTEDLTEENKYTIFTKTVGREVTISIPYNTWSPDNKYFFIQENTPNGPELKVFRAMGDVFSGEEAYLDLTATFKDKVSGNTYKEATGWASETLIIVNTTSPENSIGSSYWFEVPSKAVIQLSTLFL